MSGAVTLKPWISSYSVTSPRPVGKLARLAPRMLTLTSSLAGYSASSTSKEYSYLDNLPPRISALWLRPFVDTTEDELWSHRGATNNVTTKKGCKSLDRKSTRLNSSHLGISYAVFC